MGQANVIRYKRRMSQEILTIKTEDDVNENGTRCQRQ